MRLADRYRLLRRVGEGGGGGVYLVQDRLADDAEMVLKRLHAQAQATLAQWLVNEFQILAQLDLPTVARVFDFGLAEADAEDPGGAFFTRAFVDGTPLDEALRADLPADAAPDARAVRACFASAADTLHALHRLGVVHGDLKPANLIAPRHADHVVLIDFGLAHGALGAAERVRGGTLAFMPPERQAALLAGEALAPDPRADVYALAVSLLHVLAGRAPDERGWDALRPQLPSLDRDPALRALWDVGARGASEEVARRFATVDDFRAALADGAAPERRFATRVVLRPEGREAELGVLLDAVARRLVRREAGVSAVAVVGAEGSGRSTLLRELAWRAQLRGVQVLAVQGEAGDAPARRLRKGAEILAGEALDPAVPDALANALRKATRHAPVLILADDLDRADPAITAQLRSIAYGCEPGDALLVVASAEDEARVRELEPGARVVLPPLDESAVAALCEQILGPVEPAVVAAVHRRTGALPLAVTEVLVALAKDVAVTPADVERAEIGGRARDVAARRVAALDPAAREAAAAVAALGSEADDERARAVVSPAGALEAARVQGAVTQRADGRWVLTHGALEAALFDAMDPGALAALRRRVAEALEGADAPVTARALAWIRAGDAARADGHVAGAVAEFRRQGMPLAAARLRERLRELDPRAATAAALYEEAVLLHEAGMVAEAERVAERVGGEDPALRLRALLLRGRLRRKAADPDGAAQLLARVAAEATAPDLAAEAELELGRAAMLRGAYGEVASRCDAARARAGSLLLGAEALALGSVARIYAGESARGQEGLEEARQVFASLARPREEASILVYLAMGREKTGDLAGARELYERSLEKARAAGDLGAMVTARCNLGHIAQRMGDLGAAVAHDEAALQLARRAGLRSTAVTVRLNVASQLLRIGSLDRARAELEATVALAREAGSRDVLAGATGMLGVVRARGGEVDAGLGLIAEAHAQFAALGMEEDAADVLLDAAEVLLDRASGGDAERASERLARARATLPSLGLKEARARMLEGRVALARGDTRAALRALTEVAELPDAQRDWEVLTDALAARAHAHAAMGAELHARRDRERAIEVLEAKASLLSPDLRGAFWNAPHRAALRAEAAAQPASQPLGASPRRASLRTGVGATMNVNAPTLIANDERLVLLLEMSRRLGEEHSLERVLDQAVRSAVELTNAERGAVLLAGEKGQLEVRVRTGVHRGDGPDEQFSRSIAETVWIDGEPVVTLNAQGDRRFADFRSVHELGIGAIAAVPIRARGRTLGVLYVENRKRRVAWSPTDVALMTAFSEQAGLAVEHARLVEELEARSRELEAARREIEALLETRTHELEDTKKSLARAQEALQKRFAPAGLVAQTPAMRRLLAVIDRVRDSDVPVVIEGESGTGKEIVARALHFSGARAKGAFVVVHCGAIPETLLESELFGHVRGAFTGADRDRRGLIASAHGGTLMLDEVAEMPAKMQVELLRVLQDHRVRPVGSERDEAVDIRVVAASNRPLADLVAEGRFREDLYYRLSVVTLRIPPLRERPEDIPLLANHFLALFAAEQGVGRKRLSREALARLVRASWPGNVRQLRHALESAAILCEGEVLEADAVAVGDATHELPASAPSGSAAASSPLSVRKASERQRIVDALEQVNWNKVRAAQVLGMPRRTLYRRLREYGLLD